MGRKYKKNQLLKVEIKSEALVREGQKGFITYFRGGTDEMIIHDCRQLYPQFMNPEDKPVVNITEISRTEYNLDKKTQRVNENQMIVGTRADVMKPEDYDNETMAN